jgi:hypothetical protein
VHAAQQRLGHGERQRRLAAGAPDRDAAAEDIDRADVLSHDCDVVTGLAWLLWLEPELELLPLCVEAPELCVEVPEPLAPSLCVLPEDPDVVGAAVVALDVLPPLPRAATASQAATNVARTPAVTRRRTMRRRCLTGETGGCMGSIVADEAWIFLGIRSARGKSAPGSSGPLRRVLGRAHPAGPP